MEVNLKLKGIIIVVVYLLIELSSGQDVVLQSQVIEKTQVQPHTEIGSYLNIVIALLPLHFIPLRLHLLSKLRQLRVVLSV